LLLGEAAHWKAIAEDLRTRVEDSEDLRDKLEDLEEWQRRAERAEGAVEELRDALDRAEHERVEVQAELETERCVCLVLVVFNRSDSLIWFTENDQTAS
jgi:DNA-binding IclR family transcriptional regulator